MKKSNIVLLAAVMLAGCSVIPKDGPANAEIVSQSAASYTAPVTSEPGYVLIQGTQSATAFMNAGVPRGGRGFAPGFLRRGGQQDVRLRPGDRVSITVYEASAGGLFIPAEPGSRAGNFVQIPSQQIDARGQLVVPYAGVISASGKLPSQVATEIVGRLATRAIEPQVVVTIDERRSNDVSVLGEVNTPLRFSIDPGGTRLLGAIARAGGSRFPDYETYVSVQRGSETFRADLSTIVRRPEQNALLAAGDVVYVGRDPRHFIVFGATPNPGALGGQASRRFAFDNDAMTLAEALAKAGGLAQDRANASAVYLYRVESRERLASFDPALGHRPDREVPTIYSFDLRRGDSIFLAQNVQMRDRDVIFVADADSVDLIKMLNIIRAVNATVGEVRTTDLLFR